MVEVPIPNEIRKYETKLVMGLTTRQAIAAAVIIAICYGTWALEKNVFGMEEFEAFPALIPCIPAFLFGWYKPFGLKFEVYLKTVFVDNVLSPKVRPFVPENPYYSLLKLRQEEDLTDEEYFADDDEYVEAMKAKPKNSKKKSTATKKKKVPKDCPEEFRPLV